MKEEDKELLDLMESVEDFTDLCNMFDSEGIEYDVLDLAKQFEIIHSPFADVEPEY